MRELYFAKEAAELLFIPSDLSPRGSDNGVSELRNITSYREADVTPTSLLLLHCLLMGGDVGTGDSESIFTYKCWSTPRGNNTKEDDGGEESNLCTIVARSSYGIRTHNLAISSHNALPIELSYFLLLCNCFNFIC